MIVLVTPGIAGDPATTWIVRLRRVWMRGVVVDGAHDHAASPWGDAGQRRAFQFAGIVARFQVSHLAVTSRGDPCGERFRFAELAHRSDAAQVKAHFASELLHAG